MPKVWSFDKRSEGRAHLQAGRHKKASEHIMRGINDAALQTNLMTRRWRERHDDHGRSGTSTTKRMTEAENMTELSTTQTVEKLSEKLSTSWMWSQMAPNRRTSPPSANLVDGRRLEGLLRRDERGALALQGCVVDFNVGEVDLDLRVLSSQVLLSLLETAVGAHKPLGLSRSLSSCELAISGVHGSLSGC